MNMVVILIFTIIAAAALAFACWPLWRGNAKGRGLLVASLAVFMIAIAASAYIFVGHPDLARRSLVTPDAKDPRAIVTALAWRARRTPNDPRAWWVLGQGYLFLQDAQDAAVSFKRVIPLVPPQSRAPIYSAYGEALVLAAGGAITPEAENAFRASLAGDPRDVKARFFLGEAYAERRDSAHALALWKSLLADTPPHAPWRETLIDRIAILSGATQAPPNIAAMVEGLAERLKRAPNDSTGWQKLVKAYVVLGDTDKARAALADARRAFAGNSAELTALGAEARDLKLEK
jgi:cytochrome c-type biogenesis protein CcmH